jgi:Domain of unknown function (DUF5666)
MSTKGTLFAMAIFLASISGLAFTATVLATPAVPTQEAPAQNAVVRRIGSVKAINGSTITLTPESGPEITAVVQPTARILRLMPGEKDPKNATPIQLQDVQVGDMVRVRGFGGSDAQSINTLEVLVISRSVVAAVGDQIRQDWQKRGMGGLVDSVDAASGTITASIPSLNGKKTIAVRASKTTVIRRYSPDSVKFEDAKPSDLQQIQPGDQLRARGERSADGAQFTADEIVTGTFPYIIGTIKAVDASAGTVSVQDILSKKTVQVRTTADSQLHKIPPEIAQRFAARIKGALPPGTPGANASAGSAPAGGGQSPQSGAGTASGGQHSAGGVGGATRAGGAPDFQQLLSRLPSSTLADLQLQKGDAVVILATQGTSSTPNTAITLLSGVEPILQAAPNASQAMMLTPWSLGGAPGGDAGNQ